MKCKDCIFEIDSVCINPQSDCCDMKLFPEYDGCEDGRKSTLGISALQRFLLMKAIAKAGEQNG